MDGLKLKNEDNMEPNITLDDCAFICRICCFKRDDLRLFKDYLLDLFQVIRRNVDVSSSVEYPSSICKGCINELEDISSFINTLKYNAASFGNNVKPKKEMIEYEGEIERGMCQESKETSERNEGDVSFQESPVCQICFSSSSSLISFEEKSHLVHVFRNITNSNVKAESNSSEKDSICHECIKRLEKISAFINSSLLYDRILENAMDRNKAVQLARFPGLMPNELPACVKLELGCGIDKNEATNWNICTEAFVHKSIVKPEMIDIKEEVFDKELVASAQQCFQNELQLHYGTFAEEQPCDSSALKETLKEEFPEFSLSLSIQDPENATAQSRKKLFECNWCDMGFPNKLAFQQHMSTHTGEKPFKCDCCDKSFTYKANVVRHMLSHTKAFECDICEKKFTHKHNLKQHLLMHTGKKRFECDICKQAFDFKCHMKRHMLGHTGEKPFECDLCKKRFSRKIHLTSHMLSHTGEKPFKCDHCGKHYSQAGHLKHHRRTHTGERPFKCDSCDKSFPAKSAVKRHMQTHIKEKPFKCDCCEKSFARKSDFKMHMLARTREPLNCGSCNKSFLHKKSLQQHLLTHAGETPFKCDTCQKYFLIKSALKNHMLTHAREKPYTCFHCNKNFTSKQNLKNHMLTHTGEKRFECTHCHKSFTSKHYLKTHMLNHTGEKPLFECSHCNKSFTSRRFLKQHMLHTGQEPLK